jgi:hypothetical protein
MGPETEENTVRGKGRHKVKGSIAVQEAADEEKDHESTTDLQIHSHSTRTLVGGELCAATDGINNMLWEIAQNQLLEELYVTQWWQVGKHLS